jgi:hypothetical protein
VDINVSINQFVADKKLHSQLPIIDNILHLIFMSFRSEAYSPAMLGRNLFSNNVNF